MLTPRMAAQALSIPHEVCTVSAAGTIVPWLAADGPYAYTPDDPPPTDEYFDYGKVMPEVFCDSGRYPYGFYESGSVTYLLEGFWRQARDKRKRVKRLAVIEGERTEKGFIAPLALYRFNAGGPSDSYALIQNGSYRFLSVCKHGEVADGKIRIHQGIGPRGIFAHRCFTSYPHSPEHGEPAGDRNIYLDYVTETFVSSALAFLFAHTRTNRSETNHLLGDLAEPIRRRYKLFGTARDLSKEDRLKLSRPICGSGPVHFSMSEWIAKEKFGPNYVTFETPLTNVRISSEVAGAEYEVRLIDPDLLSVIALHGCRLVFEPLV